MVEGGLQRLKELLLESESRKKRGEGRYVSQESRTPSTWSCAAIHQPHPSSNHGRI